MKRQPPRGAAMLFHLAAVIALLIGSTAARAETYRVDLLVFLDKSAPAELGRRFELPELGKLIALDNAAALKNAGISVLPDEQFGLAAQWQRLKSARRYQPLIRLAWTQDNPPADRGTALRLQWGETLVIDGGAGGLSSGLAKPVEGSVALMLGNYLNLDLSLAYTQATESGGRSWRLREKRRMKLNEIHHLDSARLGALARISKLK